MTSRESIGTLSSSVTPEAAVQSKTDLASIFEPVVDEMGLVEEWLSTNLIDDNPFISELLAQIFKAGGKRIRVGLALLSSKATTGTGELSRLHIILAVLTELIHTASLVHDDVIDRASLRRGQETINRKWNDRLAVLVGDLLFAQASICLARLMNPVIVGIYGQVLGDLCAGEIRQMKAQYSCNIDWDAYVLKSVCKTASLFSAACHSGPILNGCADPVVAGLKEYGTNLGICFQIMDDLLDVIGTSNSLGKPAGGDLAQGVITAPAMFILQGDDAPARQLDKLIKTRAVCQSDGLDQALDIIREHGGIDKTVQLCRDYGNRSLQGLSAVEASPCRDSLEAMVAYLLTRTN
jgi:all-trans-nonaprenyl-diphosphate synthase